MVLHASVSGCELHVMEISALIGDVLVGQRADVRRGGRVFDGPGRRAGAVPQQTVV
jgi:hypothetical protein